METSFCIQSGDIEAKLVGSEDFVKGQIKDLLAFVSEQAAKVDHHAKESRRSTPPAGGSNSKLSVNSIAAKLGVTNGSELIMAAAFRLARDGQTSIKRDELLDEMKLATNYHKASYRKNLTNYLRTLLGAQKLLEQSSGVYALHADAMRELEQKLA